MLCSRLSPGRRLSAALLRSVMLACMSVTVLSIVFIVVFITFNALPSLSWQLLSTSPSYLEERIGILPDILNTVYLILTTVLVVLPCGVGAAIYLNEYAASPRLVKVIEYAIETLAGIPSIIYGLVGMLLFVQFFSLQTSLLAGALTLAIMNLPTIIRTTQESLKAVEGGYREGAFALGAGRFYMIRTILIPTCSNGILNGCILAIGRMLGESAALLFTAGFAHTLYGYCEGLSSAGASLTVALYVYAKEQGEFEVAFVIAFILLVMSLIINTLTSIANTRIQSRLTRRA